jgi:RNA polymerase sigma-70 factor (ECF subfamily)
MTRADPFRDAVDPRRQSDAREELSWLEATALGDRRAFERLYARYYPRLLGYLHRQLGSADLAEETVDDVLLVVWRSAGRFRGRSTVSTWIFGIAYRKGLKALARRRKWWTLFDRELPEDLSSLESPQRDLDSRELRRRLGTALAELSAEHRAVLILTLVQGLPYREIADIVGCPVSTVKTRMFHARRKLQSQLRQDL